jgi:hypothetical protein
LKFLSIELESDRNRTLSGASADSEVLFQERLAKMMVRHADRAKLVKMINDLGTKIVAGYLAGSSPRMRMSGDWCFLG